MLATARDITARHQAEEALAASETRYRLLAENVTDMIVLSDLDGIRQYVSPASRDLLGYEPDELIGTRPHDMVHPEDAAHLTGILAHLCAGTNDRATSTHRFRIKNGEYVWVEAQFRLIPRSPNETAFELRQSRARRFRTPQAGRCAAPGQRPKRRLPRGASAKARRSTERLPMPSRKWSGSRGPTISP